MSFIIAGGLVGGATSLGVGKGLALGLGGNIISKMFGGKDDAFKGGDPSAPAGDGSALSNNAGSLRDSFNYNPWSQNWTSGGGSQPTNVFTGQQMTDNNKDMVPDLGSATLNPSSASTNKPKPTGNVQPSIFGNMGTGGAFGAVPMYQNPFVSAYNPFMMGMGAMAFPRAQTGAAPAPIMPQLSSALFGMGAGRFF